jgi:hypothetical protein
MKAITDDSQQVELADLQSRLMELIARGANDTSSPEEREEAKVQALDLAQRICAIKGEGDAPVFLVNLTPKRWLLTRTYATYWIGGKVKGELYRSTVIAPATAWRDAGFGGEPFSVLKFEMTKGWKPKGAPITYRARDIAKDLCREINGDLPGLQVTDVNSQADTDTPNTQKFMGVFLSDTEVPGREDLEANTSKLRAYYAALVSEGNMIYERTKDYRMISSLCHVAARELDIETEWHQNLLDRKDCPGCGTKVSSRAARCPQCKWILNLEAVNEQKQLEAQLASSAVASAKGKRSRPQVSQ